jgi:hypothetical protein
VSGPAWLTPRVDPSWGRRHVPQISHEHWYKNREGVSPGNWPVFRGNRCLAPSGAGYACAAALSSTPPATCPVGPWWQARKRPRVDDSREP